MPLLLTAALVTGFSSTPATQTALPPLTVNFVLPIVASEPEEPVSGPDTVLSLISRVAEEMGISSTTLYSLAKSESNLQIDPPGHNDGQLAAGIVQIHYETWGFTREQVLDPEFSLRFAAKHIKAGDAWKYWTPMNCYLYLKYALKLDLPKMADIQPNTDVPHVGHVAVFNYSGTKHVALVTSVHGDSFTIKEANFKAGVIGTRTINTGSKFLLGFYDLQV